MPAPLPHTNSASLLFLLLSFLLLLLVFLLNMFLFCLLLPLSPPPPPPHPHTYSHICAQIADQVGELLIHCRYGCKPAQDCPGEYEVDSTGMEWVVASEICGPTNMIRKHLLSKFGTRFKPFVNLGVTRNIHLVVPV